MANNRYLQWLSRTNGVWWHDSAIDGEVEDALCNGAVGITTNPVLISQALQAKKALLEAHREEIASAKDSDARAEKIIEVITVDLAKRFLPIYEQTDGKNGYVCAQVNPKYPGDAEYMLENALRLAAWAPNVSVKLPVTAAGLRAIEGCVARGVNVTGTVSFTVSQALAVEDAYQRGIGRARAGGRVPQLCNAVIMVGRLDDYLRDVAHDGQAGVGESSLIWAGTAAMKRAYDLFGQKNTAVKLMPAGMRGAYHAAELAGADIRFSIHPKIQGLILQESPDTREKIAGEIPRKAIGELMSMGEFVKAYEPDGMRPEEFIAYGVTQKTLAQFADAWNVIESFVL